MPVSRISFCSWAMALKEGYYCLWGPPQVLRYLANLGSVRALVLWLLGISFPTEGQTAVKNLVSVRIEMYLLPGILSRVLVKSHPQPPSQLSCEAIHHRLELADSIARAETFSRRTIAVYRTLLVLLVHLTQRDTFFIVLTLPILKESICHQDKRFKVPHLLSGTRVDC